MERTLLRSLFAATLLIAASGAHASWYAARSKHFVIYADANPKRLHEFATKLERFDEAARVALHMSDPVVGDGNRLTVFVVPSASDVRSIVGEKGSFFTGFYTGRVEGSLAFVPKEAVETSDDGSASIFFHEYTHHLMMQDQSRPFPQWYVEGFAEFFSTPKFGTDGSVMFGRAVQGRAYGLFNGPKMPVQALFAGIQDKMSDDQLDVFYGRGWLLSHYLLMNPARKGQLTKFLNELELGKNQAEAARDAFGDLEQLDKDVDAYRYRPLLALKIAASSFRVGGIEVVPLSGGAAEVMLLRARVKYDAPGNSDEDLAAQVRAIEARFPGDELVESTLAEAELNATHADAAEAAASRAIAANPRDAEPLVLKGRAIEAKAREADRAARKNLFEEARKAFVAANKLDTEDPEPLYEFYLSYPREGIRPTDNAIAALHYASDLAPQDISVRMNSAIAYLQEGKLKDARSTLTVVAYSPHAEEAADVARRMMADIDTGDARAALSEVRRSSSAQSGSR